MNTALAVILVALGAGYLVRRTGAFGEGEAGTLNRFVIWICLPALILRLVPRLTWRSDLTALVLAPWIVLGVSTLLVLAFARWREPRREVVGALLLCVPLGNTSFLGFPMVGALLGEDAIRYAVIYDQFGSFLILATYGTYIVSRFSNEDKPQLGRIAIRVVSFPPFIALLVALLPLGRPPVVDRLLSVFADALVPVALFAVGLTMRLRPPPDTGAVVFGLTTKMIGAPLLAFLVAPALGASGVPFQVIVLEAAMPPMITAGAMAMMAGFAPELAAALVGYGVLLSCVSLPLIARFI